MTQPAAIEDELDSPDAGIGRVCRELIAQSKKITIRTVAEPHESVAMARLHKRLEQAEARSQLLIASRRAMLSAVGEMGGTRAWLRFFANDPNALASLEEMGAIPGNATSIRQTQTSTADRPGPSPPCESELMTDEH